MAHIGALCEVYDSGFGFSDLGFTLGLGFRASSCMYLVYRAGFRETRQKFITQG